MAAGKYDFTIEQGTTFTQDFVWKDSVTNTAINITGYTCRMQIRDTVTTITVLMDLNTANNRLKVTNGATGTFTLALTDAETTALTWTKGVYDIELVSGGGVVTRVLKGSITIDPEVTRG